MSSQPMLVRPYEEKDWDNACEAATVGLKNATLLEALASLFFAPKLHVNDGAMGVDVGNGVWRSARSPQTLTNQPNHGNGVVYANMKEVFDASCAKHADLPCMGTREILSMKVEGGVEKYNLSPYSWITYKEAHEIAASFGKGLVKRLGMKQGDMINFFADTSQSWQLACQACFQEGIIVSTTYANLGEEAVAYAIQQAEMEVVLTDAPLAQSVLSKILAECPRVKHVVYIPDRRPRTHHTYVSGEDIAASFPKGVKIHSFDEIVEAGRRYLSEEEAKNEKPVKISPESICVLMYTSGSTAKPKGVLISHRNMLAVVGATTSAMPRMGPGDVYIGYLPLAHILEMIAEIGSLASGSCIGYGSPKTLSDTGVCVDSEKCRGDAPELRPTMLAAVPMIFDKIKAAVLARVQATGGLKAKLFMYALLKKTIALERGEAAPLWDLLIFDALRKRLLGGRVRYMLSGGGPLSRDTQIFMNVTMNCPVGMGYGLSETVGACTTVWPSDRSYGRVGGPISCNQIRLEDWEEGGYFASDVSKNKDSINPRGEILVGGHNITMGYYKNEEETKKSYFVDADGLRWFRTGDVGEMFPNGTLKIVDRKKDLVKLSGGEYVSYGKLEPLLRDSKHVDNGFVYADPLQSYCVAVVTPRNPASPPTPEQVLEDVRAIFKSHHCLPFEIPKKIHVALDKAWTPESDLVTAALKLKRANLQKHYKEVLANMYAS